ncbi:hypothetical protein PC129_g1886 [Phytophthora cactorum]|uniref:Uncharacterized protein n=1 Tax=Phytophthora cactorum TaxID=29920 RepID=A0A8T1FZ64_9STRA|nr:hypothetical protein Pcac1_g27666 [Phytophthora cactorum]KAG2813262.1 hypothetical protein PC112_g14810 [Phytophthora cactorum]KAG2865657.1 hypothetical protein PC113_g3516 [Phytophthora cactorum]KAG2926291.1 hypothetical protein PC114_g3844 [Phytophthora cactorum]KAG2939925.1 hypothetical protein PC115_g2834 [Phytophthora cactorum]
MQGVVDSAEVVDSIRVTFDLHLFMYRVVLRASCWDLRRVVGACRAAWARSAAGCSFTSFNSAARSSMERSADTQGFIDRSTVDSNRQNGSTSSGCSILTQ